MSKAFKFERFDIESNSGAYKLAFAADGEYVLAQDAIDREAVLQAQIRTLEAQLKDARAARERALNTYNMDDSI